MRTSNIQPPLGTPLNRSHPLSKGLVYNGLLNEGGGRLAFDSTNNCNIPGALNGTGCVFKNSVRGNVIDNDGTGSTGVAIGNFSALNLSTSPMTVSAWVKHDVLNTYHYLVSDYNSGATAAIFSLLKTDITAANPNKFTFFWANTGLQYPNPFTAAGTTTAVVGTWYHVVGVREGATGAWTAKIYVNGRLENSTAASGNPATGGVPSIARIGSSVLALNLDGQIQNVQIWDRALSATEIAQLYTNSYQMFKDPINIYSKRMQLINKVKFNNSGVRPRPFAPGLAR